MLIGITGIPGSGRHTVLKYLESEGYKLIKDHPDAFESIVHQWQHDFVVLIHGEPTDIRKRPWFLHLNLDVSDEYRSKRREQSGEISAKDIIANKISTRLNNIRNAHVNLINDFDTRNELYQAVDMLNLKDPERLRPSWDRYFMTLADLAAQRSNCMKRRVGCVLVNENRIVATGYNGTPRGTLNCSEGGCPRCNAGCKGGTSLSTCLCLHAEENALLEAGRLRVTNSILYCNTCPCLTCSIKIVQTGVSEVVYSQDYSMDSESARILQNGGVKLRKYSAAV